MKPGDKIIVYWRDIAGLTKEAWLTKEELEKKAEKMYGDIAETVCELLANGKDYIVVAATKATDAENRIIYQDASMIMKSVIVKIKKLND